MATGNDFSGADFAMALGYGLGWQDKTPARSEPHMTRTRKPLAANARALDEDLESYSNTEFNRVSRRTTGRAILVPKPESKSTVLLKTPEQVYLAMLDVAHGYTKPGEYRFAEHLDADNILYHVSGPAGNLADRLGDCYFWARFNMPNRFAAVAFEHQQMRETPSRASETTHRVGDLSTRVNEAPLKYIMAAHQHRVPVFAPRYP